MRAALTCVSSQGFKVREKRRDGQIELVGRCDILLHTHLFPLSERHFVSSVDAKNRDASRWGREEKMASACIISANTWCGFLNGFLKQVLCFAWNLLRFVITKCLCVSVSPPPHPPCSPPRQPPARIRESLPGTGASASRSSRGTSRQGHTRPCSSPPPFPG